MHFMQPILDFLNDLAQNNDREWFNANKKRYEQAYSLFEDFVNDVLHELSASMDIGTTTAKECMNRIYRDVRFSKDKTPYNRHFSAFLAKGGRKTDSYGFYMHVQPGESYLAAGLYMPESEQLQRTRQRIAMPPSELQAILNAPDFVRYFGKMGGDKLIKAPKGFDPEHPAIELLKHKQFLALTSIADEDLLKEDVAAHIAKMGVVLTPFAMYFS